MSIDRKILTKAIVELEERRISEWIAHDQVCEHDDCPVEPKEIGCGDAEELANEYERLMAAAIDRPIPTGPRPGHTL